MENVEWIFYMNVFETNVTYRYFRNMLDDIKAKGWHNFTNRLDIQSTFSKECLENTSFGKKLNV